MLPGLTALAVSLTRTASPSQYPALEGSDAPLSEGELREILDQVDLGYLLERPGALTEETNWEEELSL